MEFFTIDWWLGLQNGTVADPHPVYEKHYQALQDVPTQLREVTESPELLHDGRVRRLHHDVSTGTVSIRLDTALSGPLECRYLGVSSLELLADPNKGLQGPHGLGDLGYDEVHRVGDRWQHRLLFSSGTELCIVFEDFRKA